MICEIGSSRKPRFRDGVVIEADLLTSYVRISEGYLENPDFGIGQSNGDTYNFDSGVLTEHTPFEQRGYSYSFTNDVMTKIPQSDIESFDNKTVTELMEIGLVSEEDGNEFIINNARLRL